MNKDRKPTARVVGRTRKSALAADVAVFAADDRFLDDIPGAAAEENRPRRDPCEVAAEIMLERALAVNAVTAAEVRKPGAVALVQTASPEWAKPAHRAWARLVLDNAAIVDGDRGFRRNPSDTPTAETFVQSSAPSIFERDRGNEHFGEALWRGVPIVGFAPDTAWLPPDLVEAADHRFHLGKLHAGEILELALRLTGGVTTVRVTEDEASVAEPRLLRLAWRPSHDADAYVRKLLELIGAHRERLNCGPGEMAQARSTGFTLDRLFGMEEPVRWGLDLKEDLAGLAAGKLSWKHVDRGVLLSSPPGCGKTTFAKALSNTLGIPLIEGSWSRWLANGIGHQGDFMIAMRKCFAEARAAAPCILFLDEVDSFPNRSELTHSQKDWDIQVVNGLLAELDGIEGREGVVVVGACNYPHLLDPALVRSGRLDRHFRIHAPGAEALVSIMREHLGDDLPDEDLAQIAMQALGSTGADVELFVRGARRRARAELRPMSIGDLRAEIGGDDRRSPEQLRVTAVHEAGHAAAAVKVGIQIQGLSLRATQEQGGGIHVTCRGNYLSADDVHDQLVFLLAGRAAEQVLIGRVTSGAGGSAGCDLERATSLAIRAAAALGFDGNIGLIWQSPEEPGSSRSILLAEDDRLRASVERQLDAAYRDALVIVERDREAVDRLSAALLDRRALGEEDTLRLLTAPIGEMAR